MTDSTPLAVPPNSTPAAPRTLTPTASRQLSRELPVRAWTVITAGVLLVIVVVAVRGLIQGLSDRALMRDGTRVNARIEFMENATRNADRAVPRVTRLSFVLPGDPPDAARREVQGTLSPQLNPKDNMVSKDQIIPIIVDPRNKQRWTDRVAPPSWLRAMFVPLLLLPPFALLVGIVAYQRRRLGQLYINGAATTASVVDVHKSPLVPSGKVLKVSPLNGGGRVLAIVQPNRLGAMSTRGDQIELIVDDAAKPRHALLAAAYR